MFINLTNIDFCPNNSGSGEDVKLQSKGVKYTINGEYVIDPDEGYDGLSGVAVIVNVSGPAPNLQSKTSNITSNGNYSISPDEGYDGLSNVDITVNVPSTPGGTDYRYMTGTVDFDGLKAIGWDDESINYFNSNAPHFSWENDDYKVTDGNKAIQIEDGVVSKYASDPNFVYCPYFDTSSDMSMSYKFASFKYLRTIPLLNTSNVTDMYQMFSNCPNLQSIPPIDTSKVTSMVMMFYEGHSLQVIPELDTSNVMNMNNMFHTCKSLRYIPQLDTSNVTDMENMFESCSSLQSIPPIDTSKVTSMHSMFRFCDSLRYIPQLDTSNVTNMSFTFDSCSNLQSIPQLNTSNVTNMDTMVDKCNNLQSVESLDMSSVTETVADGWADMFGNCYNLSSIRLTGSLNVSLNMSSSSKLDYDSVKSILTAASNTTNSDSKELTFNLTLTDQNGELASLVSACTAKGWTVNGLTLN